MSGLVKVIYGCPWEKDDSWKRTATFFSFLYTVHRSSCWPIAACMCFLDIGNQLGNMGQFNSNPKFLTVTLFAADNFLLDPWPTTNNNIILIDFLQNSGFWRFVCPLMGDFLCLVEICMDRWWLLIVISGQIIALFCWVGSDFPQCGLTSFLLLCYGWPSLFFICLKEIIFYLSKKKNNKGQMDRSKIYFGKCLMSNNIEPAWLYQIF